MMVGERDPLVVPQDWTPPEAALDLITKVTANHPDADTDLMLRAYYYAESLHEGVIRKSGQPYIRHPLAVAHIIADLKMDEAPVVAALLHDIAEDVGMDRLDEIAKHFGQEVRDLVEGVTKLSDQEVTNFNPANQAAYRSIRTAESLRRLLLAMARDFRVMVIKLADRLHNMLTLDFMSPEKRIRIASETLDVYAPIAARLGIWQIKWQLEDLAFKQLHPDEFRQMTELVSKTRGQREEEINKAIDQIRARLQDQGVVDVEIQGRPKHLYSIFNKMAKQGLDFGQIFDLLGLRIIVNTVPECYMVLGVVHGLFLPMGNLFYDYIAKPKSNGYQSLHTKVIGPSGEPMEVQIRTREMHEIAEYGIAAHWTYKEGQSRQEETQKLTMLRQQLLDWSSDARMSSDFLRSVSTDLFAEQVFVFTPRGDVIDLPKGSTPIDFAFRVHSQVGLTLAGAKVNGHIVPLSSPLRNGDVCELITRSNAAPSLDWLELAKTSNAKSKIRAYFRRVHRDEYSHKGKEALEKELRRLGLEPREHLGADTLNELANYYDGCPDGDDLLSKIGSGLISVQSVANRIRGAVVEEPKEDRRIERKESPAGRERLVTSGFGNLMVKRARCCEPIPGEDVVGFITRGKGIMLHRKACPNVAHMQDTEPERLMDFEWPSDGNLYNVEIKIIAQDRQGLLLDISSIFAAEKASVGNSKIKMLPNHTAEIRMVIRVIDAAHLSRIMTKISHYTDVLSIVRMFGKGADI